MVDYTNNSRKYHPKQYHPGNNRASKQCYRCQMIGHIQAECPNPPYCSHCKSAGHVASHCRVFNNNKNHHFVTAFSSYDPMYAQAIPPPMVYDYSTAATAKSKRSTSPSSSTKQQQNSSPSSSSSPTPSSENVPSKNNSSPNSLNPTILDSSSMSNNNNNNSSTFSNIPHHVPHAMYQDYSAMSGISPSMAGATYYPQYQYNFIGSPSPSEPMLFYPNSTSNNSSTDTPVTSAAATVSPTGSSHSDGTTTSATPDENASPYFMPPQQQAYYPNFSYYLMHPQTMYSGAMPHNNHMNHNKGGSENYRIITCYSCGQQGHTVSNFFF